MNAYKLLTIFFLCFISCEDNFQEIKNINNYGNFPIGVAQNIKLIYTDSAKVKAILTSPINYDYTNESFPYSEFPDGIKITFFDKTKFSLFSLKFAKAKSDKKIIIQYIITNFSFEKYNTKYNYFFVVDLLNKLCIGD